MMEISNKLHAMVDEFVSNMSSECSSLAKVPRQSNRTTTQVLNGLRRPSTSHSTAPLHEEGKSRSGEGKSRLEPGTSKLQDGNSRNREGGRFVRKLPEKKAKDAPLEETNNHNDVTSVDLGSENTLSQGSPQLGRGTHDMQSRGINMQTIEILSSDHSSDDNLLLTSMKYIKKKVAKQNTSKFIPSSSRGRPNQRKILKAFPGPQKVVIPWTTATRRTSAALVGKVIPLRVHL